MLNSDTKNKIYGYISKRLGLKPYRRGWLKGDCPSCGRREKYGVNLGRNRTNCFVCGYHPTPLTLVLELEGLETYNETLRFLKAFDGVVYYEPIVKEVQRIKTFLPEGFKSLNVGDSLLARNARTYVKSRGFDPIEKAYQGWGYGTMGEYFGYIIVPWYIKGELVYFNARRFLGSGPKYNNPKIDDIGIGRSLLIYNSDAMAIYDSIYVVEGFMNADTLGNNAIATGGKKISHYQISMMIKSKANDFIFLLDPDALDDSINLGLEMVNYKRIKIVWWEGEADVNDIGREETLKKVNEHKWLTYSDILKMKLNEQRPKFTYR